MTKDLITTNNGDIALPAGKTLSVIFEEDLTDKVIKAFEDKVESFEPDVSTEEGRAEIRTFANNIAKSKTSLDKAGLELTKQWRDQTKSVNESRNKITAKFDELKTKARKELTEFEDKEKQRVSLRSERLEEINNLKPTMENKKTSVEYGKDLIKLEELLEYDWQEFITTAGNVGAMVEKTLKTAQADALTLENAREVERIAKEKAEQEAKEAREKAIAAAAKAEAEAAAEKAIADAKEATAKAEAEKLKAEEEAKAAKIKAEEDKKNAEIRAKAEAEKTEIARLKAEETARIETEKAVKEAKTREIAKQKAKADAEAKELAKRAADREHKGKIHTSICNDLMKLGLAEDEAKEIVKALAKKQISHITINY